MSAALSVVPVCFHGTGRCVWSHHGYKHFGSRMTTRASTKPPFPAKYLVESSTAERVKEIERTTLGRADARRGVVPGKTEYLRDSGSVIGWDEGQDAVLSYVECSGGTGARCFHGRPMHRDGATAREMRA